MQNVDALVVILYTGSHFLRCCEPTKLCPILQVNTSKSYAQLLYLTLYARPGQRSARGPHTARQAPQCGPRATFKVF